MVLDRVLQYNKFLDGLLSKLGVEKVILAGNSFGGFLAWNYAIDRPEKVEKLILIDAAGIKSDSHPLSFTLSMHPLTKKLSHIFTPKFMVTRSLERMYSDKSKIKEGKDDLYFDLLLRNGNRRAFSKVLDYNLNHPNRFSIIGKISAPTLILWGKKDVIFPYQNAYEFQKKILGSTVKVFENAGHIPMEEIPSESLVEVEKFLIQ
ncbi:MAG: alpha/beta hydrolase [Flavobacteriaceae bacterium]|nr:MAG: alpha/beta hydrolase [Flavobacteriaceae bacterium]